MQPRPGSLLLPLCARIRPFSEFTDQVRSFISPSHADRRTSAVRRQHHFYRLSKPGRASSPRLSLSSRFSLFHMCATAVITHLSHLFLILGPDWSRASSSLLSSQISLMGGVIGDPFGADRALCWCLLLVLQAKTLLLYVGNVISGFSCVLSEISTGMDGF